MCKKRRRLLMSSQVEVLRTDDPITVCPNCGDDGTDSAYSDMSTFIGYCSGCKAFTEHYHCNFYHDGEGTYCNTSWCSICGRIENCPNCGSTKLIWTHGKCAFGTCDMWFYKCEDCGHIIGDSGDDHVDCEPAETCPNCNAGDSFSNVYKTCSICGARYYERTCSSCGYVSYTSSHTCTGGGESGGGSGQATPIWTCTECGLNLYTAYPSTVDFGLYLPDGETTCPGCNATTTKAYVCPECGAFICIDDECGYVLRNCDGVWWYEQQIK